MKKKALLKPVVGILRGVDADFFPELMTTAFAAGLTAIEVTMNTASACAMVTAVRDRVPDGRLLGMGTIRNLAEARAAFAAGAMFMVTPNLDPEVIEFARGKNLPIIAGAFSPTEVYRAWSLGADMVKVFPCRDLGPEYIHELLGPFDHIPMVAVGGVNRENVAAYLTAGAVGVGAGSSLFGREAIKKRDLAAMTTNIRAFLQQTQIR